MRRVFNVILFLLLLNPFSGEVQAELLGYWPLDGDANDISGNSYNGTIYGPNVFTEGKNGVPGMAMTFNGTSNYIDLSSHVAAFSNMSNFTVSAWIKGYQGGAGNCVLSLSNGNITERLQLELHLDQIVHGYRTPTTSWKGLYSAAQVWPEDPNEWDHIAWVNDNGIRRIYHNGFEVASDALGIGTVSLDNLAYMTIGAIEYDSSIINLGSFSLDEVRIYNNALTQEEILVLAQDDVIVVNTLAELKDYMSQSDVQVKLSPGTYTITAQDCLDGKYSNPLLPFTGNNSTYDFTGVTIKIETAVLLSGGFGNVGVVELHITGNNNVLKNLTMIDDGSVDDPPYRTACNIVMDGESNRIEGFHLTVKGSYPYGYGDAFGKGTDYVIKHQKHAACLVRGNYNHVKNCAIIHWAYGHGIFMQGAIGALIEGCYIEGDIRTTDDMLAEEGTGSPADEVGFMTIWGYRLPAGFMMSLQEDGIRTYTKGDTVINGITYTDRGTRDITVRNCTVKYMRSGVTLYLGYGGNLAESCTTIGCEVGYELKGGSIIDCSGDVVYGPVFQSGEDSGVDVDITVLPASDPYYNGSQHVAYINGSGHNIALQGSEANVDQNLRVQLGGDYNGVRSQAVDDVLTAANININNSTAYPLHLTSFSSGISGQSCGPVTDEGVGNDIVQLSYISIDNFNATEDAFVKQKKENDNYGSSAALRVRGNTTSSQVDSYLKFVVSGVGTVTNATLKIWSNDVNMGVDVYQAASTSWSEDSITWSTAPGTTGSALDSESVTTGWVEFDVTSLVTGNGTYSLVLIGDTDVANGDFLSSEGAYVPVLTITHQ